MNWIQAGLWVAIVYYAFQEVLPAIAFFIIAVFIFCWIILWIRHPEDKNEKIREIAEMSLAIFASIATGLMIFLPESYSSYLIFQLIMIGTAFLGVTVNIGHVLAWALRLVKRGLSGTIGFFADVLEFASFQKAPQIFVGE